MVEHPPQARSFQAEPPLFTGPIGDVMGARALARQLIRPLTLPFEAQTFATLVLSAALVSASLEDGDVHAAALVAKLDLWLGSAAAPPHPGPVAFVAFALAELRTWPAEARTHLRTHLTEAVYGSAPLGMNKRGAHPAAERGAFL